jgi:hypothetical protein
VRYLAAAMACMAVAAVAWAYVADMATRRRNPRYCHTGRCVRLAHHVGAHVDDAGRSWSS